MGQPILIIDDDRAVATALAELLSYEGYVTRIVGSGLAGLHQIQSNIPDVIVCDWQMPNFNGDELFRELRLSPNTSDIPFIVITGYADRQPNIEASCILIKPIPMHRLMSAIKQATDAIKN